MSAFTRDFEIDSSEHSLWIGGVKLQYDQVGGIRHMVGIAIRIVSRVGLPRSAVRELVCRMREHRVPPIEEFRGVTSGRDGIVASAHTR